MPHVRAEEVVSVKQDQDLRLRQFQEITRQQEEILDKDEQLHLRAGEVELVRREREEEVKRLQEENHEWRERALRSEHLERGSRSEVEQYVELTEMKEEIEEQRRALQLTTRDQTTASVTPPLFSYLRGTEVSAQRRFHITAQPQSLEWKENGFRLHVPDGCLPTGTTDMTLDVGVSLSGQFELPADSQLVSAVYWLRSSVKLEKPVVLEMEHCVSLTDPSHCSQLSFVITQCNQKELPYNFRPLEGGTFTPNSSFGCVSRSQFSALGVVQWVGSWLGRGPVRYCGQQILYRHPQTTELMLRFAVVKNLQPFLNAIKERYPSKSTMWFEPFTFQLDGDTLSLEVEKEGMELDSGWKIVPIGPLTVDKQELDSFSPGKSIPGFELALEWTGSDQEPKSLSCVIPLKGTTGDIFFNLRLSNPHALPIFDSEVISGGSRDTSDPVPLPPSGDGLYSKYPAGLQSKPEMEDLANEVVAEIPDLWQEVGIQLRVPYNDMLGYHERNPTAKRMFTYVLITWKERCTSEYSWANLIKVLRSPSVNQLSLANELTKKLTTREEERIDAQRRVDEAEQWVEDLQIYRV